MPLTLSLTLKTSLMLTVVFVLPWMVGCGGSSGTDANIAVAWSANNIVITDGSITTTPSKTVNISGTSTVLQYGDTKGKTRVFARVMDDNQLINSSNPPSIYFYNNNTRLPLGPFPMKPDSNIAHGWYYDFAPIVNDPEPYSGVKTAVVVAEDKHHNVVSQPIGAFYYENIQ